MLRDTDTVSRIGDCRYGVCLTPVLHMDLESSIQLSGRIQQAIEEPLAVDGTSIYVTASVGFCLVARAPGGTGQDWTNAAIAALHEAQSAVTGPSAPIQPSCKAG